MEQFENKNSKKEKFKQVVRTIFANNYPYKLLAIALGAIVWLLATGL